MNKHFALTIVSSILFLTAPVQATEDNRAYLLKLNAPSHITETAGLTGYYKGYKVDLSEQWALLPECDSPLTFSMLITENVDVKAKGNNVRYLQRIEKQTFVWFDLTLTLNPEENSQSYAWEIQSRESDEVPTRIPENTIIILTNPDFIDDLTIEPALTQNTNINLPTITFKTTVDKQEFADSLLYTTMTALNLDAIHRKDRPTCQVRKDAAIISVTT